MHAERLISVSNGITGCPTDILLAKFRPIAAVLTACEKSAEGHMVRSVVGLTPQDNNKRLLNAFSNLLRHVALTNKATTKSQCQSPEAETGAMCWGAVTLARTAGVLAMRTPACLRLPLSTWLLFASAIVSANVGCAEPKRLAQLRYVMAQLGA